MLSLLRKVIHADKAPPALGPYSQAILYDRTLYVSGVLGVDLATKQLVEGGATAEARQALKNLGEILKAGQSCYSKVVKTTILLADINDWPAVNEIYKEFFKKNQPARVAYQVAKLPLGASIEIDAIAATGDIYGD